MHKPVEVVSSNDMTQHSSLPFKQIGKVCVDSES
jgi:hypothetical protein